MLEPLKHRVLIQIDEPIEDTESEIIIIQHVPSKGTSGVVIARGKEADEELQIGTKVMFGPNDGTDVAPAYCDGLERCLLMPDSQVRAILT